ncbi:MAG TPA: type 4a pilus biogenesis protein PilO [Phycisphaerales bacterium]|nr:type 4a pilus biogenesis protein PilO [Phycisphaerales bacterium]
MNKSNAGLLGLGIICGVVGLPVASYFLVFRPQAQEVAKARQDVAHMRALLAELQAEAAKNADFEKANEELAKNIQLIEQRLPSGREVDSVVRQVSDLAVQCGLTPPAIKTGKPLPAGLYMEQPLEMETQGSFVGFHTFVAQLEKLPRVTRIHDLKLDGRMKDEHELSANFTLSIYFQEGAEDSLASAD